MSLQQEWILSFGLEKINTPFNFQQKLLRLTINWIKLNLNTILFKLIWIIYFRFTISFPIFNMLKFQSFRQLNTQFSITHRHNIIKLWSFNNKIVRSLFYPILCFLFLNNNLLNNKIMLWNRLYILIPKF
jgi:hypothetical protein